MLLAARGAHARRSDGEGESGSSATARQRRARPSDSRSYLEVSVLSCSKLDEAKSLGLLLTLVEESSSKNVAFGSFRAASVQGLGLGHLRREGHLGWAVQHGSLVDARRGWEKPAGHGSRDHPDK